MTTYSKIGRFRTFKILRNYFFTIVIVTIRPVAMLYHVVI